MMDVFSPLDWIKPREIIKPPLTNRLDYALEACQMGEFDEALHRFERFSGEVQGPENLATRGCLCFCKGEMHRLRFRYSDAADAFEEAAEFFRKARDRPRMGASLRMAGLMHALLGDYSRAENLYRRAYELFQGLWRECCGMRNRPYANRYGIWMQELSLQMQLLRRLAETSTQRQVCEFEDTYGTLWTTLELHHLPLLTSIAAGRGYILGTRPEPEGYLIADRLMLDDVRYKIHSLYRKPLRIFRERTYFVARVKGDSMNEASPVPVEEGDLVIIQVVDKIENLEGEPLFPQKLGITNGDIIAVESREGPDSYGFLKRFHTTSSDDWGVLLSESKKPYPPKPYDPQKFHLIGKAIAVLKPD